MPTEASLKSALMKEIRKQLPAAVLLRHEDQYTAGIPDISSTANGKTIWWEVKYARPTIRSRGIQHITCCNLATHGKCYYIVYYETKETRCTLIVQPKFLDKFKESIENRNAGFDHKWVATFMRHAHDNK